MLKSAGLKIGVLYVLRTSCLRQAWQAMNALSASVFAATCLGTPD